MSFYAVKKCADEMKMSHPKRFLKFLHPLLFSKLHSYITALLRNTFLIVKFQRKRKFKAYKLKKAPFSK